MPILRTAVAARLKRKRFFNKLVETIDLPRSEIMRYLIQNEENNPLTKDELLRQIKKILGVEKDWQVLTIEIPSFENIRRDSIKITEHMYNANTETIVKVDKKLNADLDERLFTFTPSNQIIRVEVINGEPLFCLSDLCKAMNLTNPTEVAKKLEDEDKSKLDLGLPGRQPLFVTEPGMYTVILRSDSPKAKPFRKWVTSEVLPALRKAGEYRIKRRSHNTPVPASSDIARLLQLISDNLQKGDKKAVAVQLGVKPASVSNILSGKTKSSIILQALYEKALENKQNGFVNTYSCDFVTAEICKLTINQ
jgi:prophage antirepressor-like protein